MRKLALLLTIGAVVAAAVVLTFVRSPGSTTATDAMPCGDLNGDGKVTVVDVKILYTYFDQTVPPAPAAVDMNADTVIDGLDVLWLGSQFGMLTDCQDKTPVGPKTATETATPATETATPSTPPWVPTPTPHTPMMFLTAWGQDVVCDPAPPIVPAKCAVPAGSQFTLSVGVNDFPTGGYTGFQTQIVYVPLTYKPIAVVDEIVWPDAILKARGPMTPTGLEGAVHHVSLAGHPPPGPASTHVGNIVDIVLNCGPSGTMKIALPVLSIENSQGTAFQDLDGNLVAPEVVGVYSPPGGGDLLIPVSGTIIINCWEPELPYDCPVSPNLAFPEPGCDAYQVTNTITTYISTLDLDLTCVVKGTLVAARYNAPQVKAQPTKDAPPDPTPTPTPNNRRDIHTELIEMELRGTCTPGDLPIILRESPTEASTGRMEEQTPGGGAFEFPADSFFDIYFEVESLNTGHILYNPTPIRVACEMTAYPPEGCAFQMVGGGGGGSTGAAGVPPPCALFVVQTPYGNCTGTTFVLEVFDTDLEGCSDERENGPDPNQGGLRNDHYFWDFYDVWTHPGGDLQAWERNRFVNIFDILRVAERFGAGPGLTKDEALAEALTPPTAATGYHAAYDRGPTVGANHWDRAPPDGFINIPHDILGVAAQFGHNCT